MNIKPLLFAAALFSAAGAASAQSANLLNWTHAGDTLLTLTNPPNVTLTTAAALSGETPFGPNSALEFFELEPALALAAGALPGDTFEGSGVAQSFTGVAGSTISFSWELRTENYNAGFADRAFVVIDGSTVLPLATVSASILTGSFSHTFESAGAHSLAIVVMDVNDYIGVSTLGVYQVAVSVVPEPATWALMLGGVAAMGSLVRRRRV